MLTEALNLINEAIFVGLLLFGVYIVSQNMRTFIFPQKAGRIVSVGGELKMPNGKKYSCNNCTLMPTEPGKSTVPVSIQLDSGETCKAEISPCSLCIDRIKVGDRVGVTRRGSRIITQKISKGLWGGRT